MKPGRRSMFCAASAAILILIAAAGCSRGRDQDRGPGPDAGPPAAPAPAPVEIQEPFMAGHFYPADEASLRAMVRKFLDQAPRPELPGPAVGLMAPHAGFIYSGQVAAYAYQSLAGSGARRVVVLGPSHRTRLSGVFVLKKNGYRTPLGVVKMDRARAEKLEAMREWIVSDPAWYAGEHSLEVQLPFLQEVFGPELEVAIVMVGRIGRERCADLARALAEVFPEPDTVFIASTDMSHGNYPPYRGTDQVRPIDLAALEVIRSMDPDRVFAGLEDGTVSLCGGLPVVTLLEVCRLRGADHARTLKYADSGDVSGDRSQVVGYGAMVFTRPEKKQEGAGMDRKQAPGLSEGYRLSDAEKAELLTMARACAEAAVQGRPIPKFETEFEGLKRTGAAFVTLKNRGRLRGCIGTIFADEPLYQCVQRRAVDAAVNDARFFQDRVTSSELDKIEIEISVLTPPAPARAEEIVVGRDGVFLTVGFNRGVFLPQVPVEQGWDREEYLANLCYKAGSRDPQCWRRPDAKLERFKAIIFSEHDLVR